MTYTAKDLISFCIGYVKEYILEGDFIVIQNEYDKISNANDITNWFKSIKHILGSRRYNSMKIEFEKSIMIDVGFVDKYVDIEESCFNIITEY